MGRALLALAAVGLAASGPGVARADGAPPPGRATIRAITGGGPDFLGLDVDVTTLRPVELEAGLALGLVFSSVYARVGYDLVQATTLDAGDRVGVFHLVLLGGLRGSRFDATGAPVVGIDALVGLDLTRWLSKHYAIDGEVVAGATAWLSGPAGLAPVGPNVAVLVGFGF